MNIQMLEYILKKSIKMNGMIFHFFLQKKKLIYIQKLIGFNKKCLIENGGLNLDNLFPNGEPPIPTKFEYRDGSAKIQVILRKFIN